MSAIIGALLLAVGLFAFTGDAEAQSACPTGSYRSIDSYGNSICKRFDGSTATVTTRPQQTCPNGAYSTIDSYGNRICRSYATPQQPQTDYYRPNPNNAAGCPNGFYRTIDNYGNKVCTPF
jgi:hypothetical protein